MQFDTEHEQGIVPMEFLGIVNNYNGVEIKQTPYYIEMSCKNYYINLFLRSHGWEKEEENNISSISEPTQEAVAALHRLEEAIEQEDFSMLPKIESSSKLLEEIRKDPIKYKIDLFLCLLIASREFLKIPVLKKVLLIIRLWKRKLDSPTAPS